MVALVVDDEELVLAVVRQFMKRAGYRVLVARNLTVARRVCSRVTLPLDLVVTDIEMPDGSGLSLGQEIRSSRPQTPVLFMSGGYRKDDPRLEGILGPGRAFVEKPFTEGPLRAALDALRGPGARPLARCACR
jgi:DNA-binding response OmpR family regulator